MAVSGDVTVERLPGVIRIKYTAGQELEVPSFHDAYEIEVTEEADNTVCELRVSEREMSRIKQKGLYMDGKRLSLRTEEILAAPGGRNFEVDLQDLRSYILAAGSSGLEMRDIRKKLGLTVRSDENQYLHKLLKESGAEKGGTSRSSNCYFLVPVQEAEAKPEHVTDTDVVSEPSEPSLPRPGLNIGGTIQKAEVSDTGSEDDGVKSQTKVPKQVISRRDTKKSGTVDNNIDGRYDERIVTVDVLTAAIQESIKVGEHHHMDKDAAREMAQHVLNFFGYNDRILDNVLEPEDRDAFYMLEETDMLKTDREETTLYDGREWRIHYWVLKKDWIYDLVKQEEDRRKAPEDPGAVYMQEVPDGVWRR
jgi:hypothetical protein